MTIELVLLLSIWGYILLGVFFGDLGPIETFRRSAPRLGAHIEKNIAIGHQFKDGRDGKSLKWEKPK
jgi:hypothetical protein